MEAEHYSKAVNVAPVSWTRIPDFGRTLSGMTTSPADAPSQTLRPSSPRLEYELFMVDSGTVDVRAYVAPSLNVSASRAGLRYAVSFDDEAPQTVNVLADSSNRAWERSVAENIRVATTRHSLSRAGPHVLKFWRVDPGVVLEKLVVDAGGVKPSYLGPPESFYRPARAVPSSDARFDWFEYSGNDSIYHSIHASQDRYLDPIRAGFYPDPNITRGGDDYYLTVAEAPLGPRVAGGFVGTVIGLYAYSPPPSPN
jgi:hypothetical protein